MTLNIQLRQNIVTDDTTPELRITYDEKIFFDINDVVVRDPNNNIVALAVGSVQGTGTNTLEIQMPTLTVSGVYKVTLTTANIEDQAGNTVFGPNVVREFIFGNYEPGDVNADGIINGNDLAILLSNFGTSTDAVVSEADLTGEGDVSLADLLIMKQNFDIGDLNLDNVVDANDLAILLSNYGTSSGAMYTDGDLNSDGKVSLQDLLLLKQNFTQTQQAQAGGGNQPTQPGTTSKTTGSSSTETTSTTSGTGETQSSTIDPARIYFTTSDSINGGGALPSSVPDITLSQPGDTIELFVWVELGGHTQMTASGFDISATNPDVIKATASELYNPDLMFGSFDIGDRYLVTRQPDLNIDGIGEEALATKSNAIGAFYFSGGINQTWTNPSGVLDQLYDSQSDAFLMQSITLEALSGSEGLSTNIILSVGQATYIMDISSDERFIYMGLGSTGVSNFNSGGTDGTDHATISVASGAQSSAALVVVIPAPVATSSMEVMPMVETVIAAKRIEQAGVRIERPSTTNRSRYLRAHRSRIANVDAAFSDKGHWSRV